MPAPVDTKISGMTPGGAIGGGEYIPCVQGGANVIINVDAIVNYAKTIIDLADVLAADNDTGSTKIKLGYATGDQVAIINSSKEIVSSIITRAQLERLTGVSGNVQSQIDNMVILVNALDTTVNDMNSAFQKVPTKKNCRLMAIVNVNLASPPTTYDGVLAQTDDRILLPNQTSNLENGIYRYDNTGNLVIEPDFQPPYKVAGSIVYVEEGSTMADTLWRCVTDELWNPGQPVEFEEIDSFLSATNPGTTTTASAPAAWYGDPTSFGMAQPDAGWLVFTRGGQKVGIPAYVLP